MIRGILVATTLVFAMGAAQADAISERKDAMKAMSEAAKPAVAMLKGAKFDLATVKASLKALSDNAKKSAKLYPAGSNKGKTRALPAVWEKNADFMAKMKKLGDDADAAAGKITDLASLKTNFPGVMKNCGGCHQDYRAKKK
ncbi:MAG: cytochrome c [Hyphomicrobiales bacterium]|nr:cytochrome c [Hyphomicrobiales bacterium]